MKKKWIYILMIVLCICVICAAGVLILGKYRNSNGGQEQAKTMGQTGKVTDSSISMDQTGESADSNGPLDQTEEDHKVPGNAEPDKDDTAQTKENGQPEGSAQTKEDGQSEDGGQTNGNVQPEGSAQTDEDVQSEDGGQTDEDVQSEDAGQTKENGQTEEETAETEKLVVAIDPGHQGNWVDMSDMEPLGPGSSEMKAKASTGTQGSYSGVPEYQLNLDISLKLRTELLQRGYEVVLTREDNDTAISNSERALKAYEEGGDIYVRIHANGSDDASVSGALAMVPSSSNPFVGDLAEDSYLLAQCILSAYCEEAAFPSLGIQYYDNMTGINWSKIPVMILEMGFMTNESDDFRMQDAAVQEKMVAGIADGIDNYFQQKGMTVAGNGPETEAEAARSLTMDGLFEQISQEIAPAVEAGERWAVSVKSLSSGSSADIDGDVPMKSASIIKAFIMAAVYDRVCYPSSEDRYIYFYEEYDGELRELINSMITVSDNAAANTIIERLGDGDARTGMEIVNQFCAENGYSNTSLGRRFLEENPSGDNYTSVNDCRNLLEAIYNGTCVCPEASAKMYEFLKQQTRTGKIPSGLSGTSAVVANKTGELFGEYGDYVENDIAIIDNGSTAYILCVMSEGLLDDASAVERIRNISRLAYEELCQGV